MADGAQYQVLEFRADCTCESAMAFATYSHSQSHLQSQSGHAGLEVGEAALNDTDDVASRLLDHAFSVGGLQEGAAINGALSDGATGLLHWTMGGSNPGGKDSLWFTEMIYNQFIVRSNSAPDMHDQRVEEVGSRKSGVLVPAAAPKEMYP